MRMKIKHLVILFLVNCGQDTAVASPSVLHLQQDKAYSNVNHLWTSVIQRNTYINIANTAGFIDAIASINTYSTSSNNLMQYKMIKFEDKRVKDSEYKQMVLMKSIKRNNTISNF